MGQPGHLGRVRARAAGVRRQDRHNSSGCSFTGQSSGSRTGGPHRRLRRRVQHRDGDGCPADRAPVRRPAPGPPPAPPEPVATRSPPVATPTIARLSQLQWANSVRDLLLLPNPGDLTLPTADAVVRLDNEADSLFVNQSLHDDLQAAAERLAAQVAADTTAIARLLPANAPTDATGKATAFIQTFGRRAYRRPLTADEVQYYLTLFNQGPTLTTGMQRLRRWRAGDAGSLSAVAVLPLPHGIRRRRRPGTRAADRLRDRGEHLLRADELDPRRGAVGGRRHARPRRQQPRSRPRPSA